MSLLSSLKKKGPFHWRSRSKQRDEVVDPASNPPTAETVVDTKSESLSGTTASGDLSTTSASNSSSKASSPNVTATRLSEHIGILPSRLPDRTKVALPEETSRNRGQSRVSLPESSLWDEAYETFKTIDSGKNAKLVDKYETLLKKHLIPASEDLLMDDEMADDLESTDSILSSARRRAQLNTMLEQGRDMHELKGKILIGGHAIRIRDQVANLARVLEFGNDWISQAVKASPEASVAWSIVCLGLPLLTKPARADIENLDGLVYVTSRMQFYIALEDLLLPQQASITASEAQAQAYNALRTCLLELYQLILDFQIRSIVRFYKGHWYGDLYSADDWKSMRNAIQELEASIQQDSIMIASNASKTHLQKLLEMAESAQAALIEIQEQQLEAIRHMGIATIEQVILQRQMLQQATAGSTIQSARQKQEQEAECLQLFRLKKLYETTKARIPRHVEGTCQWFLKQPIYTDWLSEASKCLLVSADPGCGKSVLARNLIDNELPRNHPNAQICYFFFKQGIQDSLGTALPALLHQLLYHDSQCFEHIVPLYKKEGRNLVKNVEIMLRVLWDILIDQGSIRDRIIVLDALDECESTDRGRLLTWIREFLDASSSTSNGAKFLLTCRPYDEIVSFYEYNASASQVHIPGNAESETISHEVNLVIKHRAQQLYRRKRVKKAVQEELEQRVLAQTNRTYLWVFVVFDELERKIGNQTLKVVQKILQTLPSTIYDAYEEILNRYASDEEIRENVVRILHVMLAAKRPLEVQEMQCAVKIQLSPRTEAHADLDIEDKEDFIIKLRNWCGLFIQIHDEKVTFLHQTARDFLLSEGSQAQTGIVRTKHWGGFTNLVQAHRMMTRICLTYLSLNDFSKPLGLKLLRPSDFSTEADWSEVLMSLVDINMQHPLLLYAGLSWDWHFESGTCETDDDLLEEALSLLDPSKENYENWTRASLRFLQEPQLHALCIVAAMDAPSLTRIILQKSGTNISKSIGRSALEIATKHSKKDNMVALVKYGSK